MAGEIAVGGRSLVESLLLTDLYQLSMLESYLQAGMTEPAVFEFFIRKLPPGRGYFLVASLTEVSGVRLDSGVEHRLAAFAAEKATWLRRKQVCGRASLCSSR